MHCPAWLRSYTLAFVRIGLVGLILVCALGATRGFAQPPASPEAPVSPENAAAPHDAERAERARAAFMRGLEHFRAGRHRDAITAFEEAAALVPSADVWFNIARSYEELRQYEQAAEHYRRYLRDRVDPPDRADVEARIAHLEEQAEAARLASRNAPTTGDVRIESEDSGAAVAIDARPVGETPVGVPVALGAGQHDLEVTREGAIPFRASVRVDSGVTTAARVSLVPRTEYRAVRGRRVVTWILYGLACAGLGASVGLGVHATRLNRDGNREDAERFARRADYVLGASLALGLGGTIAYFVEGRSVGTERVSGQP